MKTWYNSLSPRERILVLVAGFVSLLLLLWILLVKPQYNKHKRLKKIITSQQATLEMMKKQSLQVKRLQQQNNKPKNNPKGNTQQLIESELQTWRLKKSLERMQSQGPNGVNLILKSAHADRVMRFLYALENKYGLTISNLVLSKHKSDPGLTDVRLTIKRN